MILWHKNFHIDDSVIENMCDWLKHTKSTYVPRVKHYTSYNLASTMRPEYPMRDFYANIAEECMRDLTLFERSRYTQSFWMQLYEPGAMVTPVTITLVVKKSVLGYTFSNQLRRHFTS